MNPKFHRLLLVSCVIGLVGFSPELLGQAECYSWGGLRGIRVGGELMAFTTGVRAVTNGVPPLGDPSQERLLSPRYSHESGRIVSSGGLTPGRGGRGGGFGGRSGGSSLSGQVAYEDVGEGLVKAEVRVTANADVALAGTYFFIHFPAADGAAVSAELMGAAAAPATGTRLPSGLAKIVLFKSPRRQLEVAFAQSVAVVTQTETGSSNHGLDAYFPISTGNLTNGQTASLSFTLKATGDVDKAPVNIAMDAAHPGSPFDGVGGNFRLQSPADPPQVRYNLDNLRVAWGRVNMPLDQWQPNEDAEPPTATNMLNRSVREAMEMARTLDQKKIPIVISLWAPPRWSNLPPVPRPPGGGGGSTSHLNPDKWDHICASIGLYLEFLKTNYGVEPRLFSFNESDIGYNILQTPQEHADAIKRLGAYFAAKGLTTKMLLGDTGDPTGIDFINVARNDPEAVKYLGAVSYHSWRGGTVEQYTRWGEAARLLKLPLLIAEGGTDSDAYRYQALMLEPWYSLNEIGEYVDICRYSQPLSILQWQLTENYTLLTGGQNGQPFQPSQRFWQLKQLDSTPIGAAALPITCDQQNVAACAYAAHGSLLVHLVNTGPTRAATVSGFPATAKEAKVYVTDTIRGMKELNSIPISGGVARFTSDSMSYATLTSAP